MVHTPIDQSVLKERQKVIDWLTAHNYPALPVAPAQSPWKYHKVSQAYPKQGVWAHCPLTTDLQPIPIYTGKNPSYLDTDGLPHLVNHRQYQSRLPKQQELDTWFAQPDNGVGTLGGWNQTIWLDFDVKQFPSQQECDSAVLKILACPELSGTFVERSHSGGWRIGVRVKQKPNFTNFSLTKGGSHVGEALFAGRFTVLAPTIGPSGNPYQSLSRTFPVEVESLSAIGIYATKLAHQGAVGKLKDKPTHRKTSSLTPNPAASIPLELLGNDTSRDILHGVSSIDDRSQALATAIQEWYGWTNWGQNNGIQISGDVTTLAHYAGTQMGLDSDRINRILKTVDPSACEPAALYRGGEESCWRKISRLDQATFSARCPVHIKAVLKETFRQNNTTADHSGSGNGSGGGRGGTPGSAAAGDDFDRDNQTHGSTAVKVPNTQPVELAAIRNQIKDILIQDLPPSELQTAKIQIRKAFPGVSEREIQRLFETLEQELELAESRSDRRSEIDNLLKLGDQSLNLNEFLPTDLAQPLTQLAQALNIRPEVCLTLVLVAASSLHKTQTELVIHNGQGFSVPPTIFAGVVSESGQKKSPLLKSIINKPLAVLQREKRDAFQASLQAYENDITAWDKCAAAERSAKFPTGKPKQPQQRLYYFTNATGEGLLYQFQAHPDKALLALVDELVGLFASQNKYSGGRGSDRQDILSAFDGTGATVLRAAGTKADIDGLLLAICGTIQPEVLKRLMRDCSDPDGQWARFLFVNQPLAAATLADDDGSGLDLTGRLLNYYRAIDQLPEMNYQLSHAAFKRYQPVYNQLERLRASHPNPGMRAVYSKMEGYIGRLALNLHVLHELSQSSLGEGRQAGDGSAPVFSPSPVISLEIMEKAIALAKFYIGQVKLIHANCAADFGDMAPHLAKIVELSKRLDTTTGSSWIKAKVVQTSYDSRHRPRPDAVRSWFRELEALGIGTTRGAGIRLEYSWKLPDFPLDGSDPPPCGGGEKVEKSGEKWITSPPAVPSGIQGVQAKVEKVDNPTHLQSVASNSLDAGVSTCAIPPDEFFHHSSRAHNPELPVEETQPHTCLLESSLTSESPFQPAVDRLACTLDSQSKSANPDSDESTVGEQFVQPHQVDVSHPGIGDECLSKTQKSLEIIDSTAPQLGCNHGIAGIETVEQYSTFSLSLKSVSTVEAEAVEADNTSLQVEISREQAPELAASLALEDLEPGVVLNVFPLKLRLGPLACRLGNAFREVGGKAILNTTLTQLNHDSLTGLTRAEVTVEVATTHEKRVCCPEQAPVAAESSEPPQVSAFVKQTPREVTAASPMTKEMGCKPCRSTTAFSNDCAIDDVSATQAESRSLEEKPVSQRAVNPEKVLAPEEQVEFSRTSVGHIEVKLAEGKVVGLPVKQESPDFRTGSVKFPLLVLVAVIGTLMTGLVRVERLWRAPTVSTSALVSTTVDPATLISKADTDRIRIGSLVHWSNCPAHCEQFAPFEITAIDGDYAKLDLFSKPVPLSELHPI